MRTLFTFGFSFLIVAVLVSVLVNPNAFSQWLKQLQQISIQFSSQTTAETVSDKAIAISPRLVLSPKEIIIEKIQVRSQVEWVGLDEQGRMDVPQLDENTAWYQLGPKPGEIGNAVIAGHLDSRTGGPAIFYYLEALTPGDVVKVIDEAGTEIFFVVTKTEVYDNESFPIDAVFGQTTETNLNLITCTGNFDSTRQNYSQRLVVFTSFLQTVVN